MKIQLNLANFAAFLALVFVMHESHEIVHTAIGRLICGCWGERDFNVWDVCGDCAETNSLAILATFAAPIYTFGLIWWGYILLSSEKTDVQKSLGFALIFANMPFARLLTAALGGGDEVFGLKKVLGNHTLAWIVGLFLILILAIPPLVRAYKTIQNKRKIAWFIGFLILPMVIDILVLLLGMNTLLEKGILKETGLLGSPLLVNAWTLGVIAVLVFTYKKLNTILI